MPESLKVVIVGGVIPDRESLILQTPVSLASRFRFDVHARHEVSAIDRTAQTVTVQDLETSEVFQQPYDRLICQSGGRSAQATRYLEAAGHTAINVTGGTAAWICAQLPTER